MIWRCAEQPNSPVQATQNDQYRPPWNIPPSIIVRPNKAQLLRDEVARARIEYELYGPSPPTNIKAVTFISKVAKRLVNATLGGANLVCNAAKFIVQTPFTGVAAVGNAAKHLVQTAVFGAVFLCVFLIHEHVYFTTMDSYCYSL